VHTDVHHSYDIHESDFLLAPLMCMCWRTQDLWCCCGWCWLGNVSFSCFRNICDV